MNGKPTFRRLAARTVKLAREELAAKQTDQARSAFGLAADPYSVNVTVGRLIADYIAAGCPDSRRVPRTGKSLAQEESRLKQLRPWWEPYKPQHIDIRTLDAYADHRTSAILARGQGRRGTRAVDLELNTLKNVFKLATRSGRLKHNPMDFRRPAYTNSALVRHCRECAPRSADELHAHALHFFECPETEVFGWQTLFEAFTGCRTSEALALRVDAQGEEPGAITGDVLWLQRAKGGVNAFFRIHDALRQWLNSFHSWRRACRDSGVTGYWFPSPDGSQGRTGALSNALQRSSKLLHPGYHVMSHGLRSYYVTVRRSQGAADGQIAIELGQRTGPGLIVRVYGDAKPVALDWMPKGKPAWEVWKPSGNEQEMK